MGPPHEGICRHQIAKPPFGRTLAVDRLFGLRVYLTGGS